MLFILKRLRKNRKHWGNRRIKLRKAEALIDNVAVCCFSASLSSGEGKRPSAAKAATDFAAFAARLKPCPFKAGEFSAASEAVPFQSSAFFCSL